MSLVTIVIILVVVGIVLWLINSFVPMARSVKTILNVLVVVVLCVWLLQLFGLMGSIKNFRLR